MFAGLNQYGEASRLYLGPSGFDGANDMEAMRKTSATDVGQRTNREVRDLPTIIAIVMTVEPA